MVCYSFISVSGETSGLLPDVSVSFEFDESEICFELSDIELESGVVFSVSSIWGGDCFTACELEDDEDDSDFCSFRDMYDWSYP